jgi:hypothetical protein
LRELFPFIAEGGYALVGATRAIWDSEQIMEQLQLLDTEENIELLSMQMVAMNGDPDMSKSKEEAKFVISSNIGNTYV